MRYKGHRGHWRASNQIRSISVRRTISNGGGGAAQSEAKPRKAHRQQANKPFNRVGECAFMKASRQAGKPSRACRPCNGNLIIVFAAAFSLTSFQMGEADGETEREKGSRHGARPRLSKFPRLEQPRLLNRRDQTCKVDARLRSCDNSNRTNQSARIHQSTGSRSPSRAPPAELDRSRPRPRTV